MGKIKIYLACLAMMVVPILGFFLVKIYCPESNVIVPSFLLISITALFILWDWLLFERKKEQVAEISSSNSSQLNSDTITEKSELSRYYCPNLQIYGLGVILGAGAGIYYIFFEIIQILFENDFLPHNPTQQEILKNIILLLCPSQHALLQGIVLLFSPLILFAILVWAVVKICQPE